MRALVVLFALALAGPAPVSPAGAASRPDPVADALAVLHQWDAQRAAAWAAADEAALRGLYVPGSSAGRADVGLLRSYTDRGLVVRRLVTQVFSIEVLRRTPGRLVVRVVDRVAGGSVQEGIQQVRALRPLPSSVPEVRRIELHETAGSWQVVSVTGRALPAARH
jgi:hypothetical protein